MLASKLSPIDVSTSIPLPNSGFRYRPGPPAFHSLPVMPASASHLARKRMPRKRPLPAATCASSTSRTRSPSSRSACPTIACATLVLVYLRLAAMAAWPTANSVSPTGLRCSGPAARYMFEHSTYTDASTLCPAAATSFAYSSMK